MDLPQTPNSYAADPTSILWAHQLRLDIVNLTSSFKILQEDHARTIKTLTDLGEAVDLLLGRIHTLEQQRESDKLLATQKDAKLMELADSHNEEFVRYSDMLDHLRIKLDKTESVNQMLQGRIEFLEQSMMTYSTARSSAATKDTGPEAHQSAWIPVGNSPEQSVPAGANTRQPMQTEMETTATSLSRPEQPLFRRRGSNFDLQLSLPNQALSMHSAEATAIAEVQIIKSIVQGGRSVDAYLDYANALRAEAPHISDIKFARAFIQGHDEVNDRIWSDEMAKEVGYSWERLADLIRRYRTLGQGIGHPEEHMTQDLDRFGGVIAPNASVVVENLNRRGKRTIPIVPPDVDDVASKKIMPYSAGGS
ncbi:hypothetical protein BJX64DRAFT_97157 [Aspergillus heterothallicus]